MKKIFAMLLAALMLLSLFGCAADSNDNAADDTVVDTGDDVVVDPDADAGVLPEMGEGPAAGGAVNDSDIDPEMGVMPDMGVEPDTDADADSGAASGYTPANILKSEFEAIVTADGSKSALDIANELISNPVIAFMGGAVEVEPGWLSGFAADEITGFSEGAVFMPMIGSIPFIGYIFKLDEGADVDAFVQMLEDNADLRWQICVEADEMVTGTVGSIVFFCMSPVSFE